MDPLQTQPIPAETTPRTEAPLRASLSVLPVGLMTLDRDGTVLLAEGGVFSLLGRNASDLVGHSLLSEDLGMPWLRRTVPQALAGKEVRARGTGTHGEPVEARFHPVSSPGNRLAWVVCFLSELATGADATPETGFEVRSEFEELANLTPGVFWEANANPLQFTYVSRQADEMLGFSASDWQRDGFWEDRLHPADRESTVLACEEAVARGTPHQLEYRMVRADGQTIWVRDYVTVSHQGRQKVKLRGVMLDITELRSSNKELERSNSLMTATLEASGDAVLAVDRQGHPTKYNERFLKMWNVPESVLKSQDDGEVLSLALRQLQDPQGFVEKVLRLYAQPELDSFDVVPFKDGRVVERYCRPLRVNTEIVGRVWFFRDITAQRRAEEERARLLEEAHQARADAEASARRSAVLSEASRRLAESLDFAKTMETVGRVAIPLFSDGCALFLLEHGRFERVTATHWDPEINRTVKALFDRYPPDPQSRVGMGQVARTGEPFLYEDVPDELLQELARSEEHLELLRGLKLRSYMAVPLRAHGEVLGVLAFATLHRRFERADLTTAEEIGRRCAAALEHARLYRQTQKAVQLRDDFLAIASHELRTPLTPLKLLLGSIESHLLKGTGDVLALVRRAHRSVGRMAGLVNDLLDVSQLEAGRLLLRRESLHLGTVIGDLVEDFRGGVPTHRFETSGLEQPIHVAADRARIQQVVVNLLDNAVKYSPEGSVIRVSLWTEDGQAMFAVADQGIGVPIDQQEQIFGRFSRATTAPINRYGGLGLGLYICRTVIERHGGRIRVESDVGQGSRFIVSLPLRSS